MDPRADTPDQARPQTIIETETPCLRCGYILRGLTKEGLCPECGAQVALSAADGYLPLSDPLWVQRLAQGATLEFCSLAVLVAAVAVAAFRAALLQPRTFDESLLPAYLDSAISLLQSSLAPTLALLAAWLLTSPETHDGPPCAAQHIRLALRVFASAAYVLTVLKLHYVLGITSGPVVLASLNAATIILFWLHMRNIARLVPNGFLIRFAILAMWFDIAALLMAELLPAFRNMLHGRLALATSTSAAIVMYLGSLVYAGFLMFRFRQCLVRSALAARDHWHRPD